jgi:two-component system NtrC family sensor kinase
MSVPPDSTLANLEHIIADLRRELAQLTAERDEAYRRRDHSQAREAATAEVFEVINFSPGNLAPVFETILEKAHELCGAAYGSLQLYDCERFYAVAVHGMSEPLARRLRGGFVPGPKHPARRLLAGEDYIHVRDCAEVDDPMARATVEEGGIRTMLHVALRRDNKLIGKVTAGRKEVRPFADEEISLLRTFAAQAVIAIENVRLFTELRESLEQQTATAEILRVISQSPTDVTPVLGAVAKAALKFCGARDAQVVLRDGDHWFVAATEGPIGIIPGPRPLNRHTTPGRAILDGEVVQIADVQSAAADEFPESRNNAARLGFRSALAAPLLRDDVSIGAIALRRPEPGAFTPNQVELLKSFAAQAVIAIENVRLFTELREALEQQTATAEVLRAISQSPTDVQPVLEAVSAAARRFCGALDASITLREGEQIALSAHAGDGIGSEPIGTRVALDRGTMRGRSILDAATVHFGDVLAADPVEYGPAQQLARKLGFRAIVSTPMLRDGRAIGCVTLRKIEPVAFTPRQIDLLETFAAQAVIAIENVRLFTELRDSLERLKAAQANLIQAEKMASLGQLTAGIAHEIKNPLNFVNNFAGLSSELVDELKQAVDAMLTVPDKEKRAELQDTMDLLTGNLAKIVEHGQRADGIVKSMLAHSRGGSGDWQTSNINNLIEEALNLAYHGARAQDKDFNVVLERDLDKAPRPIDVVPQDVTRVLLNLLSNGFYATRKRRNESDDEGYQPTVKVSTRDLDEAIEIRVRDNGTGIATGLRGKLFQPFFTTKPTGEGTGLGLSISYDIVTQQHGGSIEVESEVGQYTEFTVRLPRASRAAVASVGGA